jgi:predicted nucleic acid-binding protein
MDILVDSNILIRLANPASAQYQLTIDATRKLWQAKDLLCIVPQNIYEFCSATTRPVSVNGLGFSFAQAQRELAGLKRVFVLREETRAFFPEWEKLMNLHAVVGKNAHDTRLVAAMVVHGITHLLTFNKQDFQRFTNITVLSPADVVASPPL